ncbi:MAG: thymidylate synthase [Candidatus Ratteibacteria bacterium]
MNLPVIRVEGTGIAETWEKSLIALWKEGIDMPTEYDRPGISPSKDASMVMVVNDPFAEPRIHLGFAGGIEDLEKYRQEVLEGVHDHWINPDEGKWTYTYHQRLFSYGLPWNNKPKINQISYIVKKLSEASCSRRAQAITWVPKYDPDTFDPPCLQRVWCRIYPGAEKQEYLAMHTHWRSRDAYRAAYMNIYGLTELQKEICAMISQETGKSLLPGQYVDMIDSYHIYGESFPDFTERFLKMKQGREFYHIDRLKSRTMRSDDPAVLEGILYGRQMLADERKKS